MSSQRTESVEPVIESAFRGRPNGFVVIALVVVVGFGATAGLYGYLQPKAVAQMRAERAALPNEPSAKLAYWTEKHGAIAIHTRLQTSRISFQQPWLVTHVVERSEGEPEVWGLDLSEIDEGVTTSEGLDVLVRLPEPRMLYRTRLVGDNARNVQRFAEGAELPDPREWLRTKVEYLLGKIATALGKDLPGARVVVLVGDEAPPS